MRHFCIDSIDILVSTWRNFDHAYHERLRRAHARNPRNPPEAAPGGPPNAEAPADGSTFITVMTLLNYSHSRFFIKVLVGALNRAN